MNGDPPRRDIKTHKLFEIATEYAAFLAEQMCEANRTPESRTELVVFTLY